MERSNVDMANDFSETQESSNREKQKKYDEMVYAALSSASGKDLKESLENYLTKPSWFPGEDIHNASYREGARRFVIDLLNSYERAELSN